MGEFNRKSLRELFAGAELEVPKDVIGQLCELHTGSLDGLSDAVKELQAKLEAAEQERDELKKNGENVVLKSEYDALESRFGAYKDEVAGKELRAKKKEIFRKFVRGQSFDEEVADSIVNVTKIDDLELDEKGERLKDETATEEMLKAKFGGFVSHLETKGADTRTPRAGSPRRPYTAAELRGMSAAEINKNWDAIKASLKGDKT